MAEKQKLTLSVEKELVEKAKKLGVNISEITETVLKHVSETGVKEVVTKDEVNTGYKKLFSVMLPLMKKFGAAITVGEVIEDSYGVNSHHEPVCLLENGDLYVPGFEETIAFENVSFNSKKEILSSFINSLIEASENNKEELKELEIFSRVIEALTEITIPEYSKEKKG